MNRNEEQTLGENITAMAASHRKAETAVISVRLGIDEIARLEEMGRAAGQTVSQVIRDAIASYEVRQPRLVLALCNGTEFSTGGIEHNSVSWNGQIVGRDHGGYGEPWRYTKSSRYGFC